MRGGGGRGAGASEGAGEGDLLARSDWCATTKRQKNCSSNNNNFDWLLRLRNALICDLAWMHCSQQPAASQPASSLRLPANASRWRSIVARTQRASPYGLENEAIAGTFDYCNTMCRRFILLISYGSLTLMSQFCHRVARVYTRCVACLCRARAKTLFGHLMLPTRHKQINTHIGRLQIEEF